MANTKKIKGKKVENLDTMMGGFTPFIAEASDSATTSDSTVRTRNRRNAAATQERTDRFRNIDDGMVPFNYATGFNYNKSTIDVRDTVILCQKAYYNFALFRNTIDLMTELCCGEIHFKGGNKASRDFFKSLFNKINLTSLQDRFYREYFRSGNVFIYRYETAIQPEDISKITQVFAAKGKNSLKLPIRYIIINPADIQVNGNLSFNRGQYFKVLTDYELEALRNPRTEEDKEIFETFDKDVKKQMKEKKATAVLLRLDTNKIYAIFYKKQDYEPFAVPLGFPVLEDINAKIEMKRMDMALARTIQQVVLLVTMGTEPEKGGINARNLETIQTLFQNQSVGRVLVADYTTKAEFVIPQIGEILDPKKYEVLDKDIILGLNNVLIGNDKFANAQTKVNIFLSKLTQSRKTFVNDFLLQEIKRIAKDIGFKVFPTPFYEDIDIKDNTNVERVYTRLIELGILTAEEGIKAIQTGILPTPDESLISQQEYKSLRDKELYTPLIGAPKDPAEANGRPPGKGTKQTTKKVSPIGTKASFSATKLIENIKSVDSLVKEVQATLKKTKKIKKLTPEQCQIAEEIAKVIVANEDKENWSTKISDYISNPIDKNPERIQEIQEIALEHQLDSYSASLLYHSEI